MPTRRSSSDSATKSRQDRASRNAKKNSNLATKAKSKKSSAKSKKESSKDTAVADKKKTNGSVNTKEESDESDDCIDLSIENACRF